MPLNSGGMETKMNNLMIAAAAADAPIKVKADFNLYMWIKDSLNLGDVESGLLFLAGVILCIIIPYLIGSINPAIIFSRKIYHDDIRNHGSGNAGTTNTLRTYGKKMAALILFLDFLKAVIAVIIGSLILSRVWGGAIAGMFVILGHTFPVYYKFKGGKGVASLAGVVLVLSPISFLILVPLFAAIVLMSGFVSLGSVMCAFMLPIIQFAFYQGNAPITISCFFMMLLIVFMHRANIKRLMEGKESKISFGSKKDKESGEKNKNGKK